MTRLKPLLTVTLNPAIDKLVDVSSFCLGAENKAQKIVTSPGGKGINVARALKCLGVKAIAAGFAGGANGQNFLRDLLLEGLEHHFVFIQGETRVNITVRDQKSGRITRLLEPGPLIDQKDLASFRHRFSRLAGQSEWIVLSGRGISGTPKNFYQELVETAGKAGARIIVDAAGEDLRWALKGKPFLVKPNREEAEHFLKTKLNTQKQIKSALKKFLRSGAEQVIITLGGQGAAGTDGKNFYYASGPKVKAVNTVGSGDALAAGFVYALAHKSLFKDALSFGVAAGTANVLDPVPGRLDQPLLGGILQKVIVKDL